MEPDAFVRAYCVIDAAELPDEGGASEDDITLDVVPTPAMQVSAKAGGETPRGAAAQPAVTMPHGAPVSSARRLS